MSKFTTAKNKLRKAWERIQRNKRNSRTKNNIEEIDVLNQISNNEVHNTPIKIFDSGIKPLSIPSSGKTALKGTKQHSTVSYSESIVLKSPEIFLPFIQFSIEIIPIPNVDIKSVVLEKQSDHAGDNINVKGDGSLIYKGDPNVSLRQIFSTDFITSSGISESHTKDVYRANLNNEEFVGIIHDIFWEKTEGDTETEFLTDLANDSSHEIISIDSTSFTAIGNETIKVTDESGTTTTVNEDVTRTFSFSDADLYSILLDGTTRIFKSSITAKEFTLAGKWLYYSSLRQRTFATNDTGTPDGDFTEIELDNLPDTDLGDTLPYTKIDFTRNLIDPPSDIETTDNLLHTSREFNNYFRITEKKSTNNNFNNNKISDYRFELSGDFLVASPAKKVRDDTTDFPVYDDDYTVVGTTYSSTTIDHSLLEKETFETEPLDITMKIVGRLVHPIHWKENRKYKT